MNEKKAKITAKILAALGVLFILLMAFDVIPGQGNIMLFIGIACFIIAGVIRAIAKIKKGKE